MACNTHGIAGRLCRRQQIILGGREHENDLETEQGKSKRAGEAGIRDIEGTGAGSKHARGILLDEDGEFGAQNPPMGGRLYHNDDKSGIGLQSYKCIREKIRLEEERLMRLQKASEELRQLERDLQNTRHYFGIVERRAKAIAEAAEEM